MRLAQRPAAVLLLAFIWLGAPPAPAQPAPASPPAAPVSGGALRLQRLEHLARLWGGIEHFHPYLTYREIDWDQALLEALPRVRAAESPDAYAAAVRSMLDRLGDPATLVRRRPPAPSGEAAATATPADAPPLFRWEEGEVLVLDLRRLAVHSDGLMRLWEQSAALAKEVARARAVVADLRSLPDEDSVADLRFAFDGLSRSLVHRTVQAPAERYLIHSGYAPQQGGTSGGYYSAFLTRFAESYSPPPAAANTEPPARKRLVFLTSRGSRLPLAALALQAAGDAVIVSEGEIGDEAVALRRTYDLGEGFEAVVRLGEILPMPGWPGVHADIVLPAPSGKSDGEDVALRTALAEARKPAAAAPAATPATPAITAGPPLPDAVWRPDPVYRDLKDPSLEHRLLAVFRSWNVIHYFYPYRHLIGDWDAVLPQFIARMEAVDGARDYSLTVAEMMTHVPDGHTSVSGSELLSIFGEAFLPVTLRWIDGSYVVTSVWGGAKDAGIEVGDVLVAVDGQPVEARAEFFRRILTASTEAALRNRIGGALLRGPEGSTATLTLRGRGDGTREAKATRAPFSPPPPDGETVRILPGGIGLVDLRHLERAEVDAMFDKVKDTRALIFDLRGYPRGTAWSIAPRLNVRNATVGATFRRPQIDGFTTQRSATELGFSQPLPVSDQPRYTRPTVMLIDDRTISQAEHTGLFFEAAAGTVFIGTPTAGANGDVTNFFIPGGIRIGFTGHDVRHADGRQLQRVGLQPTVEVAPTLEGIRAGRDEVLEAALRYLEEKAPAVPPAP